MFGRSGNLLRVIMLRVFGYSFSSFHVFVFRARASSSGCYKTSAFERFETHSIPTFARCVSSEGDTCDVNRYRSSQLVAF